MSGPLNLDRVLMSCATTGTGTLTLGSAIAGFQAVPAAADGQLLRVSAWEVDGSGIPNGAWETFVGVYTHAGTTLTRGTFKASSTGSAVSFGATKRVAVSLIAAGTLSIVAGADANTTMVPGMRYMVDMSAWATANRDFTLPTTAAIGDEIEVDVLVGNATYALVLKTGAGQTCMLRQTATAAATEITRLFIGGEKMRFLYAATNKWLVAFDDRIPQECLLRLSTTTGNETAGVWTTPTSISGVFTVDTDNASLASAANSRFKVRRAAKYALGAQAYPDVGLADGDYVGVAVWLNGTATLIGTAQRFAPAASNPSPLMMLPPLSLAVDDTVNYQFATGSGSKKLRGGTSYQAWFSGLEVF